VLEIGLPILYTLFVWWFSTGLILYLDGLPRWTYGWSFGGASLLLAAALFGLYQTSTDASVSGAYVAFTCAVLAWGWVEVSFLMGYVTGPRCTPCPPDATGWRRFVAAVEVIAHHELAIVALAATVLAATWGSANQIGTWTFLILWSMRQSAKLNLFLGVRNLNEQFLPAHLSYMQSYFRRRRMNLLFPVSVTLATALAVLIWERALAPEVSAFGTAGLALVGTLLTLAILEHWFLVLPLPSEVLWSWGMRSRAKPSGSSNLESPPALAPALALDKD
jgi:putative photosynthetic complex assembly protein 2